jgi:hypothetical protein
MMFVLFHKTNIFASGLSATLTPKALELLFRELSVNTVSAWLDRGVVNKVSFIMGVKGRGQQRQF